MTAKTCLIIFSVVLLSSLMSSPSMAEEPDKWALSALPSSVRLDPSNGTILENRPDLYKMDRLDDLLASNWVFDGQSVQLHSARGEYVSFQLVVEKKTGGTLKDIIVQMSPFSKNGKELTILPELFLEWAVEVKVPSTGYERTSLGAGWYPDALIPLDLIEQDISQARRLHYPLELPDFRNRIDNQRFLQIWVDQFVPTNLVDASPGEYTSLIKVTVGGISRELPVKLRVWNFVLPNQNRLMGGFQHEGFLRRMNERQELEVYQLFKRHRVVPTDPTYEPSIQVSEKGKVEIDFDLYDQRLRKYFNGEAFTDKYGYSYGPGYGEPIEQFVLPFDVYGKHGGGGWPDIVKRDLNGSADPMDDYDQAARLERQPERQKVYVESIRQVREHLLAMVDPQKTELIVYLNGLDESYFPEAWARMAFWGEIYKKHFPESHFRVDGSYSADAMKVIHKTLDYWCCHTIGYDIETIAANRQLGVVDWLYGPQMYEREENGWCGSSTFMDLELTNERLISWSCWKYGTRTWLSWGMGAGWRTGWYNSETFKDYFRDHGTGPLSYRNYNGNAMSIYAPGVLPGVHVVCPSVRLKNNRDGVEEFEYFRLLSELDGSSRRADEIVRRIVFNPYGKASIGNLEAWNHNPSQWDAARIELGNLIEGKTSN